MCTIDSGAPERSVTPAIKYAADCFGLPCVRLAPSSHRRTHPVQVRAGLRLGTSLGRLRSGDSRRILYASLCRIGGGTVRRPGGFELSISPGTGYLSRGRLSGKPAAIQTVPVRSEDP